MGRSRRRYDRRPVPTGPETGSPEPNREAPNRESPLSQSASQEPPRRESASRRQPTVGSVAAAPQAARSHRELLRRIVDCYDSPIVRAYCQARFFIINVNILDILRLSLRGKRRVLEVGCGFGLIGCYLASSDPQREYVGVDLSERRIDAARLTAQRLGLDNIRFEVGDARTLTVERSYDAALMVDLVHHLPLESRQPLFDQLMAHLGPDGRLVVKDIVPRPKWKLLWTWALDVAMTRGTDMWYWDERQFRDAITKAVREGGLTVDTYEIADWLPYPHIAYVFERRPESRPGNRPETR